MCGFANRLCLFTAARGRAPKAGASETFNILDICGHNAVKQLWLVVLKTIKSHVHIAVQQQWKPLCASVGRNDECHSVLLHRLSDGETKCHFVPPQHSGTNRHRRTPISPQPADTPPLLRLHMRSPPTHTHTLLSPDRSLDSNRSNIVINLVGIWEYSEVFTAMFFCMRTHTHTHMHWKTHKDERVLTASDTWLQVTAQIHSDSRQVERPHILTDPLAHRTAAER